MDMATQTKEDLERLLYPESDGKPMADNTLQFQWIVRIQGNLDDQYRDDPNVLVVGDLLWYPAQGAAGRKRAPDTMVVFGRPKGYRGSYLQWREEDVTPQVVFEILSPHNTKDEMDRKWAFYNRHGVEEYYLYDPDRAELFGWLWGSGELEPIPQIHGWVSPLGIRFELSGDELVIYKPDGQPFLSFLELAEREKGERRKRRKRNARRRAKNASVRKPSARPSAFGPSSVS